MTAGKRSDARRVQLVVAAACVIPALLWILQGYASAKLNGRETSWQEAAFTAGDWIALAAFTWIPFRVGRRFPLLHSRWKRSAAAHAIAAFAFSLLWASIGMLLGLALNHFPGVRPLLRSYLNWCLITLPFGSLIYLALSGLVYGYGYFVEARQREAEAGQLAAQLAEARLGALRMQLNPHFLFNSLNTVLVLVREQNSAAASRMLELLGDVLREVLRADRAQEVPLEEELRFMRQYLAIEQVRFEERLRIEWSIDDRVLSAVVPDFVLQPLMENAIKHGIANRAEGGTIRIAAQIEGGILELSVADDGGGFRGGDNGRIGLANTRERIRALYGDAASVTIESEPRQGTRIVLRLPHRRAWSSES